MPRVEASPDDEPDFPVRCRSLRECFSFDLRAPAGRLALVSMWVFDAPYRAIVSFRIAQHLRRRGLTLASRWVLRRMRAATGAEIHPEASIGPRLRLGHPNGVVIGRGVVIEPDVTILQQVTIGGPGREVSTSGRRYPRIGRGANLYAGAKVLGPVSIGAGASIGANAVVLDDVPPGALAVGIPARTIPADERKRFAAAAGGDD